MQLVRDGVSPIGDADDVAEPAALIRRVRSADLSAADRVVLRAMLAVAFPGNDPSDRLTEEDWQHALGGTHVLVEVGGEVVTHAAVVERELRASGRPLRTGYVEAVGTLPEWRGRGYGSAAMGAIAEIVRAGFELGALGTGRKSFYERLGWRPWLGPLSVRMPDGERRTPDEDGYVFVLPTPSSPPDLDLAAPLSCDWRPGDVW